MFERYALYVTPTGQLAQKGAHWLGWDLKSGAAVSHPAGTGLDLATLTQTPRKYGLHGTIKPPMVLADGTTADQLHSAVTALASGLRPVTLEGLKVASLGKFLALVPLGDQSALADMAATVVTSLDGFRAPPSAGELARRRAAQLTPAQEKHLADWGYPYVLDQFRFHLTLTGPIDNADAILPVVKAHFTPALPQPFVIDSLTLAGQGGDGMFREIHRYPLSG